VKNFLKAYATDAKIREIIESRHYADFATSPVGDDFRILTKDLRKLIPDYVKDYVSINKFM
jgi:type I restriction enzyme R subunit